MCDWSAAVYQKCSKRHTVVFRVYDGVDMRAEEAAEDAKVRAQEARKWIDDWKGKQ